MNFCPKMKLQEDWQGWVRRMLHYLGSNMMWLGVWAVDWSGRNEQMWLLYLSAFFQNIPFYRFQEAKALFYKLSDGKISLCTELQRTSHLWQPTILRFLQLLSLSFFLISNCPSLCVHIKSLQSCPTLCKPMDFQAFQAPLSMGFSRQ